MSNLDPKLRPHVREEIRQIQQRLGLTALCVTHHQEEAMAVSDRIIVMKEAEIAEESTQQDHYDRPANTFIADFIGDAKLAPFEALSTGGGAKIALAGRHLTLPLDGQQTGPAQMVLRPHQIPLHCDPAPAHFQAEILYAAWPGNSIQQMPATPFSQLFAICPPGAEPFRASVRAHFVFDLTTLRIVPLSAL